MTSDGPVSSLLPGRIGLFVRLAAQPGRRAAVLDVVNRYADGLAEEPGTELFVVMLDPDDVDVVWLHEWFADEDAQLAHRASEGFARMMTDMPDLLAGPPGVLRIDPLRMHLQPSVLDVAL